MKKQFSALLAIAFLLSGCTAKGGTSTPILSSSSQAEPIVAMGRYIEKDISPDFNEQAFVSYCVLNETEDNRLVLHSRGDNCRTHIYENGSWQDKQYSDKELLKPVAQKYYGFDGLAFYSDDNAKPYITDNLTTSNEVIGPDGYTFTVGRHIHTEYESKDGNVLQDKARHEYFCVSYNGTQTRYYDIPELVAKYTEPEGAEQASTTYGRISRQNVLILRNKNENIFYDISVEGGKRLGTLPNDASEFKKNYPNPSVVGIVDDSVLIASDKNAAIYALSTGERVATVELAGVQLVCEGFDGSFYAINKDGIWRILPQGGILQRVVDGSTCSFSAPAFRATSFIQGKDGSFYVTGKMSENPVVFKYEFSQSTPLEREKTLHLWSIKDNPTIREAAAEFMRKNPEVKVYVEIAPKEVDLKTTTENLITALLAGTGPDLIVTDGIDLATLDAQSVLAPISTEVNLLQYDKRLLPQGQLNNRQIAIGTRLFLSENRRNDASKSLSGPFQLEELLSSVQAEKQTIEQMRRAAGEGQMINPVLKYNSREEAFDAVYTAACAEIWANGFNKAAAEIVMQLMAEIEAKYICSPDDYSISPKAGLSAEYMLSSGSSMYTAGLYGKAGIVLSRMIAYSANTQNADLCIEFINTMLSDYVQTANISDGRPATEALKISFFDNENKETTQSIFVLDCLVRQNTMEVLELAPESIQIVTENYARDDGFRAIVYDYVEKKIALDTALEKASEL